MWSVAGLSLFRFCGAMWFLVVRMVSRFRIPSPAVRMPCPLFEKMMRASLLTLLVHLVPRRLMIMMILLVTRLGFPSLACSSLSSVVYRVCEFGSIFCILFMFSIPRMFSISQGASFERSHFLGLYLSSIASNQCWFITQPCSREG